MARSSVKSSKWCSTPAATNMTSPVSKWSRLPSWKRMPLPCATTQISSWVWGACRFGLSGNESRSLTVPRCRTLTKCSPEGPGMRACAWASWMTELRSRSLTRRSSAVRARLDLDDADPEPGAQPSPGLNHPEPAAAHEGVGRRRHGLQRHQILARRREDLRVGVPPKHLDGHAAARPREREDGSLVDEGESVVEGRLAQLPLKSCEGSLFARRDATFVQDQQTHGGQLEMPSGAGKIGQSQIGMEAEARGHRPFRAGHQRGLEGKAIVAKRHRELEPVRVRKHGEQIGPIPVQAS